jgi:hypothetical protein
VEPGTSEQPSGLEVVISFLEKEVREGVRHGFFDYELKCEVINGKRRRLTLKAGKSHQFVITTDGQQ